MINTKFKNADDKTSLQALWLEVEKLPALFEDSQKKQRDANYAIREQIRASTRDALRVIRK